MPFFAAEQVLNAVGIEDVVQPGLNLCFGCRCDALRGPGRQRAEAASQLAVQSDRLTPGFTRRFPLRFTLGKDGLIRLRLLDRTKGSSQNKCSILCW